MPSATAVEGRKPKSLPHQDWQRVCHHLTGPTLRHDQRLILMEAESNAGTLDLFSHLRDARTDEWRAYIDHAFVRGLAEKHPSIWTAYQQLGGAKTCINLMSAFGYKRT